MSFPSRQQLLSAAQSLCNDFASQKDVETLVFHFSTITEPSAIEYGETCLAPFLGRRFAGPGGVKTYFELLAQVITYRHMRFSEYVVDVEERKVAVKGQAEFTWTSTGETWDETFAYVLDFDEHVKVVRYQVWADTGAAFLARIGKLEKTRHKLE